MKNLIGGLLIIILSCSTAFALDLYQAPGSNQVHLQTVALETVDANQDLRSSTPPVDLDDLPDVQDLHNLDAIYKNNVYHNLYPGSLERRAVIVPAPSADLIKNAKDIENSVYIHTERPK